MKTKITKVIQDQRQVRATIPNKFVKEIGIKKNTHQIKWILKKEKLKGEVIKKELGEK